MIFVNLMSGKYAAIVVEIAASEYLSTKSFLCFFDMTWNSFHVEIPVTLFFRNAIALQAHQLISTIQQRCCNN